MTFTENPLFDIYYAHAISLNANSSGRWVVSSTFHETGIETKIG